MSEIYTIDQLGAIASRLAAMIGPRTIVAFHAEMGAGKTTLIAALCKALGVMDTIGSPTYSIINQYITSDGSTLFHMDWYRLRDEEEAISAGVEDVIYSGHPCFVEWPEKAPSLLPDDALHVYIDVIDIKTRKLRVE